MKETLRRHPPATGMIRRIEKDQDFGGYKIPADVAVIVQFFCKLCQRFLSNRLPRPSRLVTISSRPKLLPLSPQHREKNRLLAVYLSNPWLLSRCKIIHKRESSNKKLRYERSLAWPFSRPVVNPFCSGASCHDILSHQFLASVRLPLNRKKP